MTAHPNAASSPAAPPTAVRAWGNVNDADELARLCAEEGIGRTGDLAPDGTLTLTG